MGLMVWIGKVCVLKNVVEVCIGLEPCMVTIRSSETNACE